MSATPATLPTPGQSSEYRTRVWFGSIMALLAAGILVLDHFVAAWLERPLYPCLFLAVAPLVVLSTLELHALLSVYPRPPLWLCLVACLALAFAGLPAQLGLRGEFASPWQDVCWVVAAVLLAGFLWEMVAFREPGGVVVRLALLCWIAGYLGLFPSFFVQMRFWPAKSPPLAGVAAMVLVIFVTKGCDIGAYITGRLAAGRTRMTPLLSPKKTWEGLVGGLALSVVVALCVQHFLTPMFGSNIEAVAFGLIVGLTGVLGDLAESLIKRDCQQKDASQTVPGFGGVLDVVDSVLFAAPVAYWWLRA